MRMISLFNNRQQQGLMKMFRRRQRNNGVLWASIISVALSTAAMFMRRGRKITNVPGLRNFVNNFTSNRNIPAMNDAALTEFSEEFISKAVQNTK